MNLFCKVWGNNASWENRYVGGPHEANFLKLDCSKIKNVFGWQPRWHITDAIKKTCEWTKAWMAGDDIPFIMDRQIDAYRSVI